MYVPTLLLPFPSLICYKAHARVIYGLEYLMIDVVTSADPQGFVSHIVYYPKIAPYIEQGRVVTGGFKELLWSETCPGVQGTYENLLQHLRSKMAATISK